LFAFAAAAAVSEDRSRIEAAAVRLRDLLVGRYKHPMAGFEESAPPSLPLKANPHMHLFEACLAWEEVGGDGVWSELADEIAELCLARFIDPQEGWLREFFTADWTPAAGEAGRICEPGHQFEWAWLLTRWGGKRQRPDAIAAARRLAQLGEMHGVDLKRRVAVNTLLDDGSIKDGAARLWPQTERIKGHVALSKVADGVAARDDHLRHATQAAEVLMDYFAVDTPGLWRDQMQPDGSFRLEAAPASTFYHIICAIDEMAKAL